MSNRSNQAKFYPALSSKHGNVWLINVTVESDRVFAGFAYFDGGLTDTVRLMTLDRTAAIEIPVPERVSHALTHVVMTDLRDRVEFRRLA